MVRFPMNALPQMSMAYEEEQKNLKEAIPDMQAYLETETDKSEGLAAFY